ncbi:MAG: Potassium channel, inwardly rectifying, Kir [Gemmatimonadetes bacterium]|nr:Potassium channel, inwardly rectifying, Kir [Gemmatimonadota bacterium]
MDVGIIPRVTTPPEEDGAPPPPPPSGDQSDLGFGRFVAQQVRGRFLSHEGVPTSRKYGLGSQRTARFYLAALNAPWPMFIAWLMGTLLLINGIFALAYMALGDGTLQGGQTSGVDDPFLRALSFSVGVLTTVGTGSMNVVGPTAHWLFVLESLMGPLVLIGAGGLIIARVTRPRMRLRFSESAIVAPYEGGRGLMFRIVNAKPSELSDVQVRVNLALFEEVDGRRERNFHQLTLERNSVEFFTLHWTVVHPITKDSPMRGMTPERMRESEAEFLVLVNAHEETFSTRVTTRGSYLWDELRWDVKWASVFASAPDGVLAIDVDRLDRTERLDEGATSKPAALEL